ncbi:GNAT family N-acetyltransferase [Gillisia sp. JM1]|uniref:GNAT family N-acetyltransferase n=1 Tax=Gillisia sp. JM1 TaxID=1283286 RepID=UPI000413CB93|nr:GNAT family N-acetyltransferase [Gillisia sp. JM1]
MIIREASEEDTPEIVEVLKLSLGEQDLPLSESIWNFKHVENPFGKSLVFVAEEDNNIVGVRAFMRWEWKLEDKIYNTFRAVDTATHPDHQGKGIFKKLTLKAVEVAKENGDNFIFNTPNDQSRPGYLKMGWESVNKLKVALRPAYNSFWKFGDNTIDYSIKLNCSRGKVEHLCVEWNKEYGSSKTLFTPKSAEFLFWRYENNPLQQYEVFANDRVYLAAYIKIRKGLKELRISECICNENSKSEIIKIVKSLSKKFGAQVISYSPELLDLKGNLINSNIGPILTLKHLNLNKEEIMQFKEINNWSYSLGDLELF